MFVNLGIIILIFLSSLYFLLLIVKSHSLFVIGVYRLIEVYEEPHYDNCLKLIFFLVKNMTVQCEERGPPCGVTV